MVDLNAPFSSHEIFPLLINHISFSCGIFEAVVDLSKIESAINSIPLKNENMDIPLEEFVHSLVSYFGASMEYIPTTQKKSGFLAGFLGTAFKPTGYIIHENREGLLIAEWFCEYLSKKKGWIIKDHKLIGLDSRVTTLRKAFDDNFSDDLKKMFYKFDPQYQHPELLRGLDEPVVTPPTPPSLPRNTTRRRNTAPSQTWIPIRKRSSVCYYCGFRVATEKDAICTVCKWIRCSCGACYCNWDENIYKKRGGRF